MERFVEVAAAATTHPVFGTLLHDFGYKQVYATDVNALTSDMPVWERQRSFRPERVR